MAYVLCSGGLGNQMFQYAHFLSLKKQGLNVTLDTSFFKHNNVHGGYCLERCFGITDGTDAIDHYSVLWSLKYSILSKAKIKNGLNVFMGDEDISERRLRERSVIYGFWQGEKFFRNVSDKVKRKFSFINVSEQSLALGYTMENENSVAVHIRRGDYLSSSKYVNLSSSQYYRNAIAIVHERVETPHFYVFSDDIEWCKHSGFFCSETTYVDYNDTVHSYEDMYLMSKCKVVITANSSFSWWAGYLGNHKIVIRPEKYLVNWDENQDKTLYPVTWHIGRLGEFV